MSLSPAAGHRDQKSVESRILHLYLDKTPVAEILAQDGRQRSCAALLDPAQKEGDTALSSCVSRLPEAISGGQAFSAKHAFLSFGNAASI